MNSYPGADVVEIIATGVPVVASMLILSLAIVWLSSRILAAFDRHMKDHHDTPRVPLDTEPCKPHDRETKDIPEG